MEAEKLDALLLGNLDKVKDQLEAKLLLTGQPMHAKDLAVASGATLRDVVNALCDSSRFPGSGYAATMRAQAARLTMEIERHERADAESLAYRNSVGDVES